MEETTLEKVWGQLFDEVGNPTLRLGQLLRGLAVHIVRSISIHRLTSFDDPTLMVLFQIEDYEPCHSIVITPSKMIKYYENVKLPNEIYPWDGTPLNVSLMLPLRLLIDFASCL